MRWLDYCLPRNAFVSYVCDDYILQKLFWILPSLSYRFFSAVTFLRRRRRRREIEEQRYDTLMISVRWLKGSTPRAVHTAHSMYTLGRLCRLYTQRVYTQRQWRILREWTIYTITTMHDASQTWNNTHYNEMFNGLRTQKLCAVRGGNTMGRPPILFRSIKARYL